VVSGDHTVCKLQRSLLQLSVARRGEGIQAAPCTGTCHIVALLQFRMSHDTIGWEKQQHKDRISHCTAVRGISCRAALTPACSSAVAPLRHSSTALQQWHYNDLRRAPCIFPSQQDNTSQEKQFTTEIPHRLINQKTPGTMLFVFQISTSCATVAHAQHKNVFKQISFLGCRK
jgi:hypothetical protein